jgi:hypothetical protein
MQVAREPKLDPTRALPVLEGWVGLTEAGELLGVSRQYSYRMAAQGKYMTLHRVGSAHMFVVKRSEVERMMADRAS